jgi:single-strand DNA-binding protein
MNLIQIAGHLGADPVTRFTATGQKVTTFTVATNSKKGGNDVTIWFRVTVWGDRFDKMMSYLKKGSAVIVIGELQKPELWTNKEGQQQISLDITAEIIRFSPFGKPDRQEGAQGSSQSQAQTYSHANAGSHGREGGFGEQTFGGGGGGGSQHGHKQKELDEEEELPF